MLKGVRSVYRRSVIKVVSGFWVSHEWLK